MISCSNFKSSQIARWLLDLNCFDFRNRFIIPKFALDISDLKTFLLLTLQFYSISDLKSFSQSWPKNVFFKWPKNLFLGTWKHKLRVVIKCNAFHFRHNNNQPRPPPLTIEKNCYTNTVRTFPTEKLRFMRGIAFYTQFSDSSAPVTVF